jgi:hypothetical protein
MKKRKTLRQAFADAKNSKLEVIKCTSSSKTGAKVPSTKTSTNASASTDDDGDEYWERMERKAQGKFSSKKRQQTANSADKSTNGDSAESVSDSGSDSDSDSDSSDESECGIALDRKVEHISEEYTFEFNDMREDFTEGITTLLKSKLIPNPSGAYDVACAVSSQTAVGTAIVCEGGDDVFAFATVLPLVRHKTGAVHAALQQLAHHLGSDNKFAKNENATMMMNVIMGSQQNSTGVLLHQRFSNLPPQLIGHLHRNLNEDLGWAQGLSESNDGSGDGSSAEDHSVFKALKHILLVAPCTMNQPEQHGNSKANKKRKKGDRSSSSSSSGNSGGDDASVSNIGKVPIDVTGSTSVIFDNFEDEVYFQEATCSFSFMPSAHGAGPENSNGFCIGAPVTVALLPASSFSSCVKGIMKLLNAEGVVGMK